MIHFLNEVLIINSFGIYLYCKSDSSSHQFPSTTVAADVSVHRAKHNQARATVWGREERYVSVVRPENVSTVLGQKNKLDQMDRQHQAQNIKRWKYDLIISTLVHSSHSW